MKQEPHEPEPPSTPPNKRPKLPEPLFAEGVQSLDTPEKPGVAARRVAGSRAVSFGQPNKDVDATIKGPSKRASSLQQPVQKGTKKAKSCNPAVEDSSMAVESARVEADPLEIREQDSSDEDTDIHPHTRFHFVSKRLVCYVL